MPHEALARMSSTSVEHSPAPAAHLQVSQSRSPTQSPFPEPTSVNLNPDCSLGSTSPNSLFFNLWAGSSPSWAQTQPALGWASTPVGRISEGRGYEDEMR